MADSPVDYNLVLADLEEQRKKIDGAISGIRAMLGMASANGASGASDEETTETPSSGAFLGLSLADATVKYLNISRSPQSTRQICEALKKGGVHSAAKDFYNTMYAVLKRRQKHVGDVVKVGKKWGLAEWYPGRSFKTQEEISGPVEEDSTPDETPTSP